MATAICSPDPCGQSLADTAPSSHPSQAVSLTGALLGSGQRYEVLRPIGRGGNSVVYEVLDRVLERKLAGKFILCACDCTARLAAELEARATCRLNHPNIVTVHDVGIHEGVPYLLMELLDGVSLAHLLERERLAPRKAVAIVLDVASALTHAHERGVFHFDLKPGNVHITADQSVKLLDFGVGSQRLDPPGEEALHDEVVGTPQYMAPEQWSLKLLDARTDVWALGVLLYECLTGQLPFDGGQPGLACARGVALWTEKTRRELRLGPELEFLLLQATRKDPAQRFPTVASLAAALSVVSWLLLDEAITGLSALELRVAAAADVPSKDFTDRDVNVLTAAMSRSSLALGLRGLVKRGALSAHGRHAELSYRNIDRTLTRACFERLPAHERRQLLARRFALGAPAPPKSDSGIERLAL